jgi:hypothetical protein
MIKRLASSYEARPQLTEELVQDGLCVLFPPARRLERYYYVYSPRPLG